MNIQNRFKIPVWSAKHEFGAAYGFVERNFRLVRRYIGWEIVFIFYLVVNALTIGLIGVGVPGIEANEEVVLFLLAGALLWGFLSAIFSEVAHCISWERWEGTIEYTFMAPVHRITQLVGSCLFAILYGLIRTVIVFVAASLFFNVNLLSTNLSGALLVLAAASLSFTGLGLVVAVLPLLSPEKGPQAASIFQAAMLLVSGVYFEVSALPLGLRYIAMVSPGTYTLRAARAALLDNAPLTALVPDIVLLLFIGVILVPLGYGIFLMGERYAMKTGRLKRSG